jgi:ketosteroid isomerase-like protein
MKQVQGRDVGRNVARVRFPPRPPLPLSPAPSPGDCRNLLALRRPHPWEPTRVDNVARVRDAFRAFAERDSITVGRLIGNGVVWRVPGRSAMAGEYHGRAEIFEFLRRTADLTGGTYRTEVVDVWGSEELVVALYRAVGSRDGRELDIPQALVFRFEGDVLLEVLAVPCDPAAFDAFWG